MSTVKQIFLLGTANNVICPGYKFGKNVGILKSMTWSEFMLIISVEHKSFIKHIFGSVFEVCDLVSTISARTIEIFMRHVIVGDPNRKKMHIFGFVGIFEYIC